MEQHGGIITQDDLKNYRAKSRTPIKANWNGGFRRNQEFGPHSIELGATTGLIG